MQKLTSLLARLGPPRQVLLVAVIIVTLVLLGVWIARRRTEPFAELDDAAGPSTGAPVSGWTPAWLGGGPTSGGNDDNDNDGNDSGDGVDGERPPETAEEKARRRAQQRARRLPLGNCPLRSQGYSHWSYGADPTVPGSGVCCRYKDNVGCKTEWWNDGGVMKLRVKPGAPVYTKAPKPTNAPTAPPVAAPTVAPVVAPVMGVSSGRGVRQPSGGGSGNNPHQIPDFVTRTMGLDADQVSTIMSMIGGPEQSNVEWWKGNNGKSVYGYCENINDNRGVTMGVPGFVSKYGEFDKVFKTYGVNDYKREVGNPDECRPKSSKCKLCDWISARGEDPKWIDAQWKVYHDNYFTSVPKYVPKQFADNALIKGLLLDTAMNAGIGSEGNAWGMDKLAKTARGSTPMEWVTSFCDLRYDHFTTGNTEQGKRGRLLAWRTLAKDGKWDMRDVDPCKYAYCYNGSKLGGCKGCRK